MGVLVPFESLMKAMDTSLKNAQAHVTQNFVYGFRVRGAIPGCIGICESFLRKLGLYIGGAQLLWVMSFGCVY